MDEIKYQWIKGDKQGDIEVLDYEMDNWIYFKSGNRINNQLLNEYLIQINNETDILSFDKDTTPKYDSVIHSLLDKIITMNSSHLDVQVPIKYPFNDFYKILVKSFDKNIIDNEIKEYIKKQIDIKKIELVLNDIIDEFIKNKYDEDYIRESE